MLPASWRALWVATRNKLLSNPAFQRWAAGFPLTRGVADGRADDLFDLVAGFVYSQVLFACIQLKLLDRLAGGPQSADALAGAMELSPSATERLLAAAAALGLVDRLEENRFALGPQGAALCGNAGLADMIAHHALLYTDLADPVALLRRDGGQGRLAAFWPYAEADDPANAGEGSVSAYSALMAASQPMIAADIIEAYPFHRHRRLLDVGGGAGAFLEAVARTAPPLDLMLFDLPAVAARAQSHLESAGLGDRARAFGGDALTGPLPAGADVISFVRVLHDHDDSGVLTLLRAARAALEPGGTVVVAEPMSRAPRRDPMADAYFGLYLFAMGRGRVRQPIENMKFLREAGFGGVRRLRTRRPMLAQVIVGRA